MLTAEQVVFPGVVEKQTLKPDNDEFGHRFEAVALDSNDTVWTLETSVHPAPALVAGRTAFCPFDGNVVAVDIRDGSIFWRYAAGSGLDTGSPAMVDETLYVPDRRSITTLNAVTGRKRWKADRVFDGNVLGVAVAEDLLLASGGTSEDPLLAFDRRTGEVAWSVPAAGKSIPVIDGDAVFVMDSRQLAARAVTDGSQLWTRGDVDDSHRPAVADGTIYTPSEYANGRRELLAIDTATGETQWRSRIGPKVLTGPPVVGAESVFVQTGRDGQVLIIAYDRTTGNRRWEQTARLGVTDALVLGDNALYFLGQPDNAAEVNTGAVYVIE
ncbi:MAG: PQQ-binding-like beta-propeller repeat protein [Halobacteriales archaeon]